MSNKLHTSRPIKRTARGQLPKNYVAGSDTMKRSPMTIGVRAESMPDRNKDRRK